MESLSDAKRLQAQQWIADGIARGLTITEACSTAFVSRQTFYNWLDTDEPFRRRIAYAEDEAASEMDCELFYCARQAKDDPKYQRALIYYLQRRERRRERQEDREFRAELLRMKQEHDLRLLEAATGPAPEATPTNSDPHPHPPALPHPHPPTPAVPRLTTPMRRGAGIPVHLRPTRHLYRAATGPLSPVDLPLHGGDGHCFDFPEMPSLPTD